MTRVKINVSGTHFEFERNILDKREPDTLTKMCKDAETAGMPLEFIADRPSDCFAAVLSYYQTDELHMPATVCPKAFRKELNYWGVAETDLDKCCLHRYFTFFSDFETHEHFSQETLAQEMRDVMFIPISNDSKVNRLRRKIWKVVDFKENTLCAKITYIDIARYDFIQQDINTYADVRFVHNGATASFVLQKLYTFFSDFETHEKFSQETLAQEMRDVMFIPIPNDNKVNRLRRKVWAIVDFKGKTLCAKIYLTLVFLMVMLCIMTLAFSTVPTFQRKLSTCELLEYLDHSEHDRAEKARIKFGNPDCSGFSYNDLDDLKNEDLIWEEEDEYYIDGNLTTSKTNITLPEMKVRLFMFEVLENISAGFFTTDLLLRLFTCPSLIRFCRSIINIFDVLPVAGFYIHIVVISIEKEHRYNISWIRFINYLQIFRVMRLFRIVKNVRASRVLTFSLRQNGRDMTLLVLLVMIGVSTSACLIYFIEDRDVIESIPIGWYWAMITLTTVGYGDVTPKSGAGRTVAALLSICGVLLLAITLPMFVNHFLTLYQYSCFDETMQQYKKGSRKLKSGSCTKDFAVTKKEETVHIRNKDQNKYDGGLKS